MVYVQNKDGQPIMPTENHAKVRSLLKQGKAKVVKRCPFTIRLLYDSTNYTQPLTLGVDAGSKHIGLSVTSKEKEYYASEVEIRNDIVELLSTRRQNRRARRNRLRYRKARFLNRVSTKKEGWLAPSIQNKVQAHLKVVEEVYKILPITNMVVEVASFDIQKIKNPDIQGTEYQQGEQLYFFNVREYVMFRDGHVCQCCKGISKKTDSEATKKMRKVLNVHHIESRKVGGDAPNNLITLCEVCHKGYHAGTVKLPDKIKRGMTFKDAAFMGIMRWAFYNTLKGRYENVSLTYGYLTKNTRIANNLKKTHCVDARCISGNPQAVPLECYFYQKKVRCHNRQIHKANILKGGIKKRNQAEYLVRGFRLFDKVSYQGKEYYVFGRRSSGFFDIRTLDGTKVNKGSISYKELRLLEKQKHYLTERRTQGRVA